MDECVFAIEDEESVCDKRTKKTISPSNYLMNRILRSDGSIVL
jgi:hypothetical protein